MAATTTLRVDLQTRDRLRRLSALRKTTTAALIAELATEAEERMLLDDFNASFATLRQDDEAWGDHVAETALWDGTLGDSTT